MKSNPRNLGFSQQNGRDPRKPKPGRRTAPAVETSQTILPMHSGLMPRDAQKAVGQGVRAERSKSGAVSFDLFVQEDSDAPVP